MTTAPDWTAWTTALPTGVGYAPPPPLACHGTHAMVDAVVAQRFRHVWGTGDPAFPVAECRSVVQRWWDAQPRGKLLLISRRAQLRDVVAPPVPVDVAARVLLVMPEAALAHAATLLRHVNTLETQAQHPVLVLVDEAHTYYRSRSYWGQMVWTLVRQATGAVVWTPWPVHPTVRTLETLVAAVERRPEDSALPTGESPSVWAARYARTVSWSWAMPLPDLDTTCTWLNTTGWAPAAWQDHQRLLATHAHALAAVMTGAQTRLGTTADIRALYRRFNTVAINRDGARFKRLWLGGCLDRIPAHSARVVIVAIDVDDAIAGLRTWNAQQLVHRRRRTFCPSRATSDADRRRGLRAFAARPGSPHAADTLLLDALADTDVHVRVRLHTVVLWDLPCGTTELDAAVWRTRLAHPPPRPCVQLALPAPGDAAHHPEAGRSLDQTLSAHAGVRSQIHQAAPAALAAARRNRTPDPAAAAVRKERRCGAARVPVGLLPEDALTWVLTRALQRAVACSGPAAVAIVPDAGAGDDDTSSTQ